MTTINNCFYCGNECNQNNSIKEFVKKTFTNYDLVKGPSSKFVCEECVWAFGSKSKIAMNDGEIRSGSPRNYSWLITEKNKIAYTKKHVKELRSLLFSPPKTKFKLILSDSGQKHLIFRMDWANSQDNFYIQFEEEKVLINIEKLKYYLDITDKLSAAIGKVALLKCTDIKFAVTIEKYYGHLNEYEKWIKIYTTKFAKLAVWLTKNKKESQNEFLSIDTK